MSPLHFIFIIPTDEVVQQMSSSQPTRLGGSVILDNIIFTSIFEANIRDQAGVLLPASTGTVGQWVQGNVYSGLCSFVICLQMLLTPWQD